MTSDQQTPTLENLHHTCQSLRKMVQALAIIGIVLSASLNIFLLRQVTLARRDLQQRQLVLTQYEEKGFPLLNQFLNELGQYAQKDEEFAQILGRYFPNETLPGNPSPDAIRDHGPDSPADSQ